MFSKYKTPIIIVSILLIGAIILFVFRKKIFPAQNVADGVGTDNINVSQQTPATVPATTAVMKLKAGDPVYATVDQDVQRIKVWGGYYHTYDEKTGVPFGTGQVAAGTYLGTFIKYSEKGAYIKADPKFSYPYYFVHAQKIYTK